MSADLIKYVDKPHPVSGVTNAKLAIWCFIASEIMLFGGLFSAYVLLRVGAVSWPDAASVLNVPLATINTFILISSSVTMVMAWASCALRDFGKFKLYMALTILLSLAFLVIKFMEYSAKFEHHHYPSSSIFYAIYFTMTGLHGLHIIGGVVVNAYLLLFGKKMWDKKPEQFTGRVEVAGLYWHFVDLVWILLFPTLYLV